MRISDWSSDVCSSDLYRPAVGEIAALRLHGQDADIGDQIASRIVDSFDHILVHEAGMWVARSDVFVAEVNRTLIDIEGTQRTLGQVARNGYGEPACPRANLHNVVVRLPAMADHKLDRGVTELAEVDRKSIVEGKSVSVR